MMIKKRDTCYGVILSVAGVFLILFATIGSVAFTSTVAAANVPDTFLFDDFSDGNDDGWTHFTFSGLCGTWNVTEGVYDISNYVGDVGSCTWTTSTFSFAGDHSWTDYIMRGDFRHNESRDAVFFIVRVQENFQDNLNSYRVGYSDGSWTIDKWVNNSPSTLVSTTGTLQSGVWYNMEVSVSGTAISLSVNGSPMLQTSDISFAHGAVGLEIEDCQVSFDNIAVTGPSDAIFTQLTFNLGPDIQPSWSHDGARIAFLSEREETYGMWITPASHEAPQLLMPSSGSGVWGPFGEQEPKWSPDDNTIVYQSTANSYWDIYTIPSSGGDSTRITDLTDCVNPAYSPDGSLIVFRHYQGGNYDLYSIPYTGGVETRLTTNPGEESWPEYSPDGTNIVFQYLPGVDGSRDIYVMPASGGSYTPLTNNAAQDHISPSWSPDGRWIAFTSDRAGNNDIWIMDSRGEDFGLYQVTTDTADDQWPSWSPDGSRIVYQSDRSGNRDLWVASCLPTTCGDVNQDCLVDIGDALFIINYLFKGGPAPVPWPIGDVNCDDALDVGDALYIINYLFKGGPSPCQPTSGSSSGNSPFLRTDVQPVSIEMCKSHDSRAGQAAVHVVANLDVAVSGLQIEITYDPDHITTWQPTLTERTQGLQLYCGAADGVLRIGILDINGQNHISAGRGSVVKLNAAGNDLSSVRITTAILVDMDGSKIPVDIAKTIGPTDEASGPSHFSLSQNRPNPFNPETDISYSIPVDGRVVLDICNIRGQKVTTLVEANQAAGHYTVRWDGTDKQGNRVASGVYFYRIQAGEFEQTKKMILMK